MTANASYAISYFNINNTNCFNHSNNSTKDITTSETEHRLSGLEEGTMYNITVSVMLTDGVTAEDSLTATTLTAGRLFFWFIYLKPYYICFTLSSSS